MDTGLCSKKFGMAPMVSNEDRKMDLGLLVGLGERKELSERDDAKQNKGRDKLSEALQEMILLRWKNDGWRWLMFFLQMTCSFSGWRSEFCEFASSHVMRILKIEGISDVKKKKVPTQSLW